MTEPKLQDIRLDYESGAFYMVRIPQDNLAWFLDNLLEMQASDLDVPLRLPTPTGFAIVWPSMVTGIVVEGLSLNDLKEPPWEMG